MEDSDGTSTKVSIISRQQLPIIIIQEIYEYMDTM